MSEVMQYFSEKFREIPAVGTLQDFRRQGMDLFEKAGIPPARHEEWKYTRIQSLFRKDLVFDPSPVQLKHSELDAYRIPHEGNATELVFVNGSYHPALSSIRHKPADLVILPLEEAAAGDFAGLVSTHLGHSAAYHPDGINALNSAFASTGLFLFLPSGSTLQGPVYVYHITDSREAFRFAQPRILVYCSEGSQLEICEHYVSLGGHGSFTNEVVEIISERDAIVNYYKLQHEGQAASHAGTTHFRQIGKSLTNAVTISLSGHIIRNNLNMVMESEHGESHMYGLYLLNGSSHVDNHTIVDNMKPHCFSNELYKGIMDDQSTGVFNGKIFVRKDAQKTNAYQSNKNILLGGQSTVNTKPQLEIFADDVKCSHGCTVGRLDEEAMFYLRSRGLSEKDARSMLLHAFAIDILENIKPPALRSYADQIISERLDFSLE